MTSRTRAVLGGSRRSRLSPGVAAVTQTSSVPPDVRLIHAVSWRRAGFTDRCGIGEDGAVLVRPDGVVQRRDGDVSPAAARFLEWWNPACYTSR
ncbi:hypothetical protein AB0C59_10375 [Streptomyces sp. NPDC048664]|uniref:hypothetical protein n=1 Tax=Streptomyces sp. NPDC048664 TaxID=3154505 RepID=UPI00341A05BD